MRSSPLKFQSLADLCAEVDAAGPRRYLIRGIWPADASGAHSAPMKAQKTWNADDLAVSVASGTPWLGHFEIDDPGRVVMFVGEGGKPATVRRLRAVCASRGLRAEDLPITVCARAPRLRDTEHLAAFQAHVDESEPRLVILDPFYLSAGGAKGGDLYGMGELLESVQLICAGTALFVVHHFNRGSGAGPGRISGAGPAEWGRVLINADVKSRHKDPLTKATTVVSAFDVIGGEIPDAAWRLKRTIVAEDPDDLDSPLSYTVEVVAEEGDTEDDDMPPARRKLLEAVHALTGEGTISGNLGATQRELVDWIADKYGHGLYRTTVSTQLNEARKAGLVDCLEDPGHPTQWFPPLEGVAGVVTTPTQHPTTGDTRGALSLSSRLKDDNTPTPHDGTLDLSSEEIAR